MLFFYVFLGRCFILSHSRFVVVGLVTAPCEAATGKKDQIPFSLTLLVPPVFPGDGWDVPYGFGIGTDAPDCSRAFVVKACHIVCLACSMCNIYWLKRNPLGASNGTIMMLNSSESDEMCHHKNNMIKRLTCFVMFYHSKKNPTYPWNIPGPLTTCFWRESFRIWTLGCLGYVPGLFWNFLRITFPYITPDRWDLERFMWFWVFLVLGWRRQRSRACSLVKPTRLRRLLFPLRGFGRINWWSKSKSKRYELTDVISKYTTGASSKICAEGNSSQRSSKPT